MHVSTTISFSLLSAILSLAVFAAPFEFNLTAPAVNLEKRAFNSARLTYYDITTSVTACGGTYSNSAHVVALNGQQFGSGYPGPYCGKQIRITANGKSYNANVVDKCPDCPYAGLDLTEGLFSEFASPDVGVLTGSWDYV
ncbi:hypothetical protein ACEPAF_4267 [Sanghuangporus sanghuang]